MSSNLEFTHNLVKGRIAETVFAQMFRNDGNYTVLEFGYEKIIPQLVGVDYNHENPAIETLRVAPDFAVIKQDTGEVRLIEVKYRRQIYEPEILGTATKMHKSWNPSYLFIATLDGFFFGEITDIIAVNGKIEPLNEIPEEVQREYLKILCEFEATKPE